MKLFIVIAAFAGYAALSLFNQPVTATNPFREQPKDEYVLSKDASEKEVPFSHANHANKNYNPAGDAKVACVTCHHTDQPASEAAKTPGLKTAHPADRTTTLTAETTANMDVFECRDCHARADEKPRIGTEIPSSVVEGNTDPTVWTAEEAYHKNCNDCHDAALELRKNLKIPGSSDCRGCHTGAK